MKMLAGAGVRYCVGLHDRMPEVERQEVALRALDGDTPGPLVVRWNLHRGFLYQAAKQRYEPFDRLVDEDRETRLLLARMAADAFKAGQKVWITANNKAEGSAPAVAPQTGRGNRPISAARKTIDFIGTCNPGAKPLEPRPLRTRVCGRRGDIPPLAPVSSEALERRGRRPRRPNRKRRYGMAMPTFTMRQLLEAGVHFGHHTRRWNPKMKPYLFGVRNGVHIIDLTKTVPLLEQALLQVRQVVSNGGRVLFVGTKAAAAERIADAAKRCGQYYVNHRWLGGMITNWQTISASIKRLRELDERLKGDVLGLTKKEQLDLTRERDKLERSLGGIKEMGGTPDMLFIIDTNKEAIAVQEARKRGIPIVAVLDSNSDPDGIDYPIPGNDDAIRAVSLYCELMSGAVLDGIRAEIAASGGDVGELERAAGRGSSRATADGAGAEAGAGRISRPALSTRSNGAGRKTGPRLHLTGLHERSKTWLRSRLPWSRNCARRPARA